MPRKYRTVVFIGNGDQAEFDRWFVEYDEDPNQGFWYLMRWEYSDDIPLEDSEPWGNADQISIHMDGTNKYVVSYNWHLSYVGLTQIIEEN